MTFEIERLCCVYSVAKGEHWAWRKVRVADRPVTWRTRAEAEGYVDLCFSHASRRNEVRVVEVPGGDCEGHVASADDPKRCGRCGIHIDDLRPPDDSEACP